VHSAAADENKLRHQQASVTSADFGNLLKRNATVANKSVNKKLFN